MNGPAWPVVDCGKFSFEVKDWEKEILSLSAKLTEEEESSKYAKYYHMGPATPSQENLIAAERGQWLDLGECYRPEQFKDIMTSDAVNQIRTGYRVLDDGIGFAVIRVETPGVTNEKMQHYIDHFKPEGDLYYKTWLPGPHLRHYKDMALEDVGCGFEAIQFVDFIGPAQMGFYRGMPKEDVHCIAMSGGNGISYPLHAIGTQPRPAMSIRYTRSTETGRETIMTFWHGLHWKDGRSVRMIDSNAGIGEADVRAQVQHCIYELTTEGRNILEFWNDWQNGYFC